ncbi:BsuPI-related putative proteinase inhibitor [Anaerobacillus sp. MEB173]|uniref:BsuPI-related putative proteinase inhibitor n=1 Tax=Anaerobacillus sp. MEB173 TaxID=3383345 RepID=UPI003F8EF632
MKRTKISYLLLSSLVAAGLLVGCGTSDTNSEPEVIDEGNEVEKEQGTDEEAAEVELVSHVDITNEEDGTVKVVYSVSNETDKEVELVFSSSLQADYIVYDEEGQKVAQYSDDAAFSMALQEHTLQPSEGLVNEFEIEGLPNGNYTIDLFLNLVEGEAVTTEAFTVENSIYYKGVGLYVGQADPHTIEVELDGIPTAFQLTEHAQEQLVELEEGSEITFIYTDTEIEQKTIERFILQ